MSRGCSGSTGSSRVDGSGTRFCSRPGSSREVLVASPSVVVHESLGESEGYLTGPVLAKSRTTPKASGFDLQEQRRARTQGTAEVVHGNNGSAKRGKGHGRAGAWGAGGCLSKEKGATGWPGGQGGRRVHGRRRRATKQQRRGRRAMVTGRRCRGGSEAPEADDGGATQSMAARRPDLAQGGKDGAGLICWAARRRREPRWPGRPAGLLVPELLLEAGKADGGGETRSGVRRCSGATRMDGLARSGGRRRRGEGARRRGWGRARSRRREARGSGAGSSWRRKRGERGVDGSGGWSG